MTVQEATAIAQESLDNEFSLESIPVNYVEEIETVIAGMAEEQKVKFGHDPESGYRWKFKYGTVDVFIQLTGTTDDDSFTVWSSVLPLPVNNEPKLMRLLLEMNWTSTFEARYAIVDNRVVILSSRTVADLSPVEISRSITIVATLADENDEPLIEKFGIK